MPLHLSCSEISATSKNCHSCLVSCRVCSTQRTRRAQRPACCRRKLRLQLCVHACRSSLTQTIHSMRCAPGPCFCAYNDSATQRQRLQTCMEASLVTDFAACYINQPFTVIILVTGLSRYQAHCRQDRFTSKEGTTSRMSCCCVKHCRAVTPSLLHALEGPARVSYKPLEACASP